MKTEATATTTAFAQSMVGISVTSGPTIDMRDNGQGSSGSVSVTFYLRKRARPGTWSARNLPPHVSEMDPLAHFAKLHRVAEAAKPAKDRVEGRRCLGCGKMFVSAGCANRLCQNWQSPRIP
jgi:hypothetical protein